MFVVLGLQMFPSQLIEVALPSLTIAAVLVLIARPLAVMATLLVSRYSFRERLMISWVGLRGAVPIVLATFPLAAGIDGAGMIFDVVFFTVLISVPVQGTTIARIARRLGVDGPRGDPDDLATTRPAG